MRERGRLFEASEVREFGSWSRRGVKSCSPTTCWRVVGGSVGGSGVVLVKPSVAVQDYIVLHC